MALAGHVHKGRLAGRLWPCHSPQGRGCCGGIILPHPTTSTPPTPMNLPLVEPCPLGHVEKQGAGWLGKTNHPTFLSDID